MADIEKKPSTSSQLRRQQNRAEVLPTRIPNLLVNGSDGIAVGMATKIPPHNLTEIVDATITLVNNPGDPTSRDSANRKGPRLPHLRNHPR